MPPIDESKDAEAVAWFLNLRDPATADWDGFTDWLEQDPAHGALYEAVAFADGDYAALVAEAAMPVPSNDNPQIERRRLPWVMGWAAATAAVIGAFSYPLLTAAPQAYAVETAAGERHMVKLDDGTRIELNGDTRITLHKGDARFASLDRGEATFTVIHDASHPFTVHVGDDQVQDVGTMFNIVRGKDGIETSVGSGAVLYNPDREAVQIVAGHRLQTSTGNMALSTIAPSEVATWRSNRLIFKDASLDRVATDLSRNLGMPVRISPDIAMRRFSGVIMLNGDRATLLPRIGSLLDVTMKQEFDGWRMSSRVRDDR